MQRSERKQVGFTNRWQLPLPQDSDLLGSSQAVRAVRQGFSESMMRIMAAGSDTSLSEDSSTELLSLPYLKQKKSMSLPCVVLSDCISTDHIVPIRRHSWHSDVNAEDIFSYHSQSVTEGMEPEISLECLGIIWELHRPYLIKSNTLAELFRKAVQEETPQDAEETFQDEDRSREESGRERTWRIPAPLESFTHPLGGQRNPSQKKCKKITISLDVDDKMVTKTGFAIALRNLYSSECKVDCEDVLGVLAAAALLKFPALFYHCLQMMKTGICSTTISDFYSTAEKYNQEALKDVCEQWLTMNLVPKLRNKIYLRQIPEELMQKVLMSSRLFTFSEYHLFRTVLYWIYLQQNPMCQILPAHRTVLSYFNRFSQMCSFLECEQGQKYMTLFQCLRLHGITEARQLEEIQQINILPLKWMVQIFSSHYQALQNGGDEHLQNDIFMQKVRVGLIVEQNPDYHTQIFSRYGFFFQLKVIKHRSANFSFFMQRLNPTGPNMPFCTNNKNCCSLRREREVSYEIQVLVHEDGTWQEYNTGLLTHNFGLTNRTCKSKVLKAYITTFPIYVTFAILFPPS